MIKETREKKYLSVDWAATAEWPSVAQRRAITALSLQIEGESESWLQTEGWRGWRRSRRGERGQGRKWVRWLMRRVWSSGWRGKRGRIHGVAGEGEWLQKCCLHQEAMAGCGWKGGGCSICECNYCRPPKSDYWIESTLWWWLECLISFCMPFIHKTKQTIRVMTVAGVPT